MTTNNIVNATIILEFDNGEYAITGTKNKVVIDTCAAILKFKRMPKNYFENYSLAELDIEGGKK
jgi:hypothetical protein